jgi:hypothetical protein
VSFHVTSFSGRATELHPDIGDDLADRGDAGLVRVGLLHDDAQFGAGVTPDAVASGTGLSLCARRPTRVGSPTAQPPLGGCPELRETQAPALSAVPMTCSLSSAGE